MWQTIQELLQKYKGAQNGSPKKEKPLICQAGSAEAFADSAAIGRERIYYRQK
jgi:hypothetical protein